jgi:HlyD family secretion protein
LLVAVRVDPNDVDQVTIGQNVSLRFTGFERRRMPEATGTLEQLSPDLVSDPQNNRSFYTANVRFDVSADPRWPADLHLQPGMPVEAFLTTGNRTVLSYLVHPFVEELQLAFREQ